MPVHKEGWKEKGCYFLTAVKFIYPVLLAILAVRITHSFRYALLTFVEVFFIFLATKYLAKKNIIVSWIMGVIMLFIVCAQAVVLFFCGTYIQLIMLTNLNSLEGLRGKALLYGLAVAVTLVVLFLPTRFIPIFEKASDKASDKAIGFSLLGMLCVLGTGIGMEFAVGFEYSPIASSMKLLNMAIERNATDKKIQERMHGDNGSLRDEFYSDTVGNGVDKPLELNGNPNVVLIFTEGLSKNIVEDPRNIMPNVSKYAKQGMSFEKYYDHTAATYRGIIGQLYSSHQYHNGDTNVLISLQEIFKKKGYATAFVNSEPENGDFTEYLKSFGYDQVTSGNISDRSLTDEEDYELLFDLLKEGIATGVPQFVTTYTFGTHVTFDSDHIKYGDGSNRLLNRFYNCDHEFGRFMKKLRDAGYSKNTVVVFTADHATYVDDDYSQTFYPDYERMDTFCDRIPLVIWYEGIKPESIDVGGRNSLCMAPTVLDYLDMDSPNYFLGSSLFQPIKNDMMETIFCVPDSEWRVKTNEEKLRNLTEEETRDYMDVLERYLSLTMKTDSPIP